MVPVITISEHPVKQPANTPKNTRGIQCLEPVVVGVEEKNVRIVRSIAAIVFAK